MPSDEELMTAASRGDFDAFGELVRRHRTSAWNAAYSFTGDSNEAEDIAQDAFLRILEAAPRYQVTAQFRTYLYRVVTRLCLDRAKKRRPFYSDNVPESVDSGGSPLDRVTAVECKQEVKKALEALPATQRMATILRFYEGLSYAEIAAVMETTAKAVERLLARGRETLEKTLAHLLT